MELVVEVRVPASVPGHRRAVDGHARPEVPECAGVLHRLLPDAEADLAGAEARGRRTERWRAVVILRAGAPLARVEVCGCGVSTGRTGIHTGRADGAATTGREQ